VRRAAAMDALVGACVEEVALEGRAGCSPAALWSRLEDRQFPITGALRPRVWAALRGMPDQIQFTTRGLLTARCGSGSSVKLPKRPRGASCAREGRGRRGRRGGAPGGARLARRMRRGGAART
jgi:hypothetical protein